MTTKLFEAALGIAEPWAVDTVKFDEAAKVLTVVVDFKPDAGLGRRRNPVSAGIAQTQPANPQQVATLPKSSIARCESLRAVLSPCIASRFETRVCKFPPCRSHSKRR